MVVGDESAVLDQGVAALREIVAIRQKQGVHVRDQAGAWRDYTPDELWQTLNGSMANHILWRDREALELQAADRCAREALEVGDPRELKKAMVWLYRACVTAGRRRNDLAGGERRAALSLAELISLRIKVPHRFTEHAAKLRAQLEQDDITPDWSALLSVRMTERHAKELLAAAYLGATAQVQAALLIPDVDSYIPPFALPDLLSRMAQRQAVRTSRRREPAAYDNSDANVKLCSITLSGFRGTPAPQMLTFATRKGGPTSTIIFGENGTGKSSIVDAIEFALQGRIGRSFDLESPHGPAARNWTVADSEPCWAEAQLSNGVTVHREAHKDASGVTAVPADVRPGFRLAPLTIKRADILRFLDTEAMNRGAVLLDYFPAYADAMAARPEQESRRLRSEMARLFTFRAGLAEELAPLLGEDPETLADRSGFDQAVRQHVIGTETPEAFAVRDGWQDLEPRLNTLIRLLYRTHVDLKAVKKRLENMQMPLNPEPTRSQRAGIETVLDGVGREISLRFKEIATRTPVEEISVVFGKAGPLALDMVVELTTGQKAQPHHVLSEANLDLLALLFFASVAQQAALHGQAKILILDDVFQSIDAEIRRGFLEYLLIEFNDWQLIITTHDRRWHKQLEEMFREFGLGFISQHIRGWDSKRGPQLDQPGVDTLTRNVMAALGSGDPKHIASTAAILLESVCDSLTKNLQLSLPRKDWYTLADLWPPVRQRFANGVAAPAVSALPLFGSIRNQTVHADPLGQDLTLPEAVDYADAVMRFYNALRCPSCHGLVNKEKKGVPTCGCGKLAL
ncbi:energy-coupling factor transporter ATP-binding protein EcfA2 [Catenulispora sp. GP43]|uniref:AAA family ATPase n=1 Tax=Catenulispora sp. GP43 TaxID=3156263 RepID=UPI003512CA0A